MCLYYHNLLTGLNNPGLVMRNTGRLCMQAGKTVHTVNSAPPVNYAHRIINFEEMLKYLKLKD